MSKLTKFGAAAVFGFATLAGAPHEAAASSIAYACNVSYSPVASTLGTKGSMWVNYYTGPNCSGSFIEQAMYCSTGATDSASCDMGVLYNEAQLIALWQNLQRAAAADQKLYEQSTTSSWHVRGSYVQFHSN